MGRIPLIDRYIIWQYVWPFFISIGAFAMIGIVDIVFYLIELSVISGISSFVVIRLILYKLPATLLLFFPIGVLVSTMLILVRMIKDNEYLILRASGVPSRRIIAPLVVVAAMTSLLAFYMNESIIPKTNRLANALIAKEIDRKPPPVIAEDIVFKGTDNRFFYANRVDRKTGIMRGVLIFEDAAGLPRLLVADKAQWGLNTWTLWQGKLFEFDSDSNLTYTAGFQEMKINIQQQLDVIENINKSPTEMDSSELNQQMEALRKSGIATQSLEVEYALKQAIPFACIVFGLVGIGYCSWLIQSGKDWWGVIIAIGVSAMTVLIYFFLLALFRALGKGGAIPPFWAAWSANIIVGTAAIGLLVWQTRRQ